MLYRFINKEEIILDVYNLNLFYYNVGHTVDVIMDILVFSNQFIFGGFILNR